jgi:t-SNARE complex subunit (syntaxin)
MSSSTGNLKTIKVNPIFLSSANSSGQVKNKTRKEKPSLSASLGQTNNVQKKLIARIKDFQQTGNKNNKNNNSNNSNNKSSINNSGNTTEDEFNESLKFLDDLAQDKHERKNMKH